MLEKKTFLQRIGKMSVLVILSSAVPTHISSKWYAPDGVYCEYACAPWPPLQCYPYVGQLGRRHNDRLR